MTETVCPVCKTRIPSEAELFLHKLVHEVPFGTPCGLNKLPFVLFGAVAEAMGKYAEEVVAREKDRQIR